MKLKLKRMIAAVAALWLLISASVVAKEPPSADDIRYMSAIIYAEAANQCDAGQQAVGIVVMNRVHSDLFENTVKDVIYQKRQFSPVENGRLDKALKIYDEGKMSKDIIFNAEYALSNSTIVFYENKPYILEDYFYFSGYVKDSKIQIQDHQFK